MGILTNFVVREINISFILISEGPPNVQAQKIVNCYPAGVGQFPHQDALLIGSGTFCGCSLIDVSYVPRGQYELSCDKDSPALFSKAGFLRVHNIHSVHFV